MILNKMGYGKVGFGKDEMLSYKQKHNSAVHDVCQVVDHATLPRELTHAKQLMDDYFVHQ